MELLVVIGLIGIISAIVMVVVNPAEQFRKTRDTKRMSETMEVQNALNQYQIKNGSFPDNLIEGFGNSLPICQINRTGTSCLDLSALVPEYIVELPIDPLVESGSLHSGYEAYFSSGQAFVYAPSLNETMPIDYIGRWKFTEPSGSTFADVSESENVATCSNCPSNAGLGRLDGYATSFDGSNVDLTIAGNPSELQITGDQTICLWLYPTALNARRNPFAKAYGGEGTITQETNGSLSYYYGTAGGNNSPYMGFGSGGGSVTINTWNHACIIRNLDNMQLSWYVNSELKNSGAASYSLAVASTLNATIGDGYVSGYHGKIDDIRIYNRALSESEVTALYEENYNISTLN